MSVNRPEGAQAPRDPTPGSEGDWLSRPTVRPGTRGWFRGGRWMAHRERCGLTDEQPLPPLRDACEVRSGLHRVLGRLGLESASLQAILLAEWPELVGADVARHSRPGTVRNGELTVFVRGSLWYAQLKRVGVAEMQASVVRRLGAGCVNRVVLRPDPQGGIPS